MRVWSPIADPAMIFYKHDRGDFMADEPKQPSQDEIDQDRAAVAAVPAIYIDTWYLNAWRGHVRITFGESLGKTDSYRTAVVMELDDAQRMINQLQRLITRRRKNEEEIEGNCSPPHSGRSWNWAGVGVAEKV